MDYRSFDFDVNLETAGFVIDVDSLNAHLARLTDCRHARGKRYALVTVLVYVVLARLAGEDRLFGISQWVRHRRELLAEALHLWKVPAPCVNTYRRILQRGRRGGIGVGRAGILCGATPAQKSSRCARAVSICAIQRADVALLVIDADAGVLAQDQHVAHYILVEGKGIVIVVNKWDLIEKVERTLDKFTEKIRSALAFIAYAPVVFVSAKTHQRVRLVIEHALQVRESFRLRVQTSELNELLREATRKHAPTSKGKRMSKFLCATQVEGTPPTFVFFVNDKRLVHFTYERYLENQIRARWVFEGAPLKMIFRNRRDEKQEPCEGFEPSQGCHVIFLRTLSAE